MDEEEDKDGLSLISGGRGLLEAVGDDCFDRITDLAATALNADIALLSFACGDRILFRSVFGAGAPFTNPDGLPRAGAPCASVIDAGSRMMVENAQQVADERGSDESGSAALIHMNAYLGVPVRGPDGDVVASLSAMCHDPRRWSDDDIRVMDNLATFAELACALSDGVAAD